MLLTVDPARGAFDHTCHTCGVTRRGLRIASDLTRHTCDGVVVNLGVHCPACQTLELFRLDIAPHEAGEGRHPDSLAGTRFPDTGGVVSAHDVDGSDHPHHREQATHILALKRALRLA